MIYKSLLKPLLFQLDPEKAHETTCRFVEKAAKNRVLESFIHKLYNFQSPSLSQTLWGRNFRNPIGLAAGFDKNGCLIHPMETLGMGFVEVGSITAQASCGNPKPRAFRLPKDQALINRMGLNNDGAKTVVKRLQNTRYNIPAGVNIAKTHDPGIMGDKAIEDYIFSYKEARKVADYITINISCPNTAEGKTFEEPDVLNDLLSALQKEKSMHRIPTLVKFSPDLGRPILEELLAICETHHIDGYIMSNTSSSRKKLKTDRQTLENIGRGGVSGAPLASKSIRNISWVRTVVGKRKPIIGVGGINSFDTALQMLQAGANLLQIYTGLVYEGPALVKNINSQLAGYLEENGLDSINQIT